VSIVIFFIRWIILLFQINFNPILADIFLFVAEICPTAFMLYVFRRYGNFICMFAHIFTDSHVHSSGDGEAATPNGASEVRIVRESIKSSFIAALNAKSLFSTSLDEEDEVINEYSKAALDPNLHATYLAPDEMETGLEAYWETSALPSEYDSIPDGDDSL
jgi:hypothetical protein